LYQPSQITVTDSGIFLDGGSIRIEAMDALQIHYMLYLDHCFKAQDSHTTQLYLNQNAIEKNSADEALWLKLLLTADYAAENGHLASLHAEPWLADPADVADLLQKAETNPIWMSKYLVHQLITHMQSPAYHAAADEALIRI
jgi:hypothetical protein